MLDVQLPMHHKAVSSSGGGSCYCVFTLPQSLPIFHLLRDFPPRRVDGANTAARWELLPAPFLKKKNVSTARGARDRASVLISSELPGVIPAYCMCPDPETGCIPMPPRRLALKTQATVPTEAARTHSISTGGGDCG